MKLQNKWRKAVNRKREGAIGMYIRKRREDMSL